MTFSFEWVRHQLRRCAVRIPFSIALEIADADGVGVQAALLNAYAANLLLGRKLPMAKRLAEARRHFGKGLKVHQNAKRAAPLSSEALVRAYQEDADRKRVLIRRAEADKGRLTFVAEALRRLVTDQAFVRILGEEGLHDLPLCAVARGATPESQLVRGKKSVRD